VDAAFSVEAAPSGLLSADAAVGLVAAGAWAAAAFSTLAPSSACANPNTDFLVDVVARVTGFSRCVLRIALSLTGRSALPVLLGSDTTWLYASAKSNRKGWAEEERFVPDPAVTLVLVAVVDTHISITNSLSQLLLKEAIFC
jgi:hypothetical protein